MPKKTRNRNRRGGCGACSKHGGKHGGGKHGGGKHGGSKRRGKRGGSFYKPLVGSNWGPNVSEWPGVDGIRNNYKLNTYNNDVPLKMKLGGKTRKQGGGGLIPQDLANVGNNLQFNIGSAYNAFAGYARPVNPMPYADQFARINV
jgi:hypothetical protein